MRKNIIAMLCVVIILVIPGCASSSRPPVEKIYFDNTKPIILTPLPDEDALTYWFPLDFPHLERSSNIIAKVKILPGFIDEDTLYADGFEKPVYENEYRKYFKHDFIEAEALEVYTGEIQAGDIITISEQCYTEETETEIIIWHHKNYGPSKAGEEYIFFMRKAIDQRNPDILLINVYIPMGFEMGRYPVIEELSPSYITADGEAAKIISNYTNEQLSLGIKSSKLYRVFFQEVIDKYYD